MNEMGEEYLYQRGLRCLEPNVFVLAAERIATFPDSPFSVRDSFLLEWPDTSPYHAFYTMLFRPLAISFYDLMNDLAFGSIDETKRERINSLLTCAELIEQQIGGEV